MVEEILEIFSSNLYFEFCFDKHFIKSKIYSENIKYFNTITRKFDGKLTFHITYSIMELGYIEILVVYGIWINMNLQEPSVLHMRLPIYFHITVLWN